VLVRIVTLIWCWWDCKMVQLLCQTAQQFLKKLKLLYDPSTPLLAIPKVTKSKDSRRYTHVHSSTIPNSQQVQTIQVSINRWMYKQNMVYICNGILLFTYKKGWISDACHSMDEPGMHHVKWNKSDPIGQALYGSRIAKFTEIESWMMSALGWQGERGRGRAEGVTVSRVHNLYLEGWKVLETDSYDSPTTLWIYMMPLNYTFKNTKKRKYSKR